MRGDLADRLLAIDLTAISEHDRKEEGDVEAAFQTADPAILAAVLDLTAAVLRLAPSIHLARRPRMAAYGQVLATVDAILGTAWLYRYMAQRGELQLEAVEGDRIGSAVIAWMEDRAQWTGTAAELLEAITPERRPSDWPTTPRGLAGALRRVAAAAVEAAGVRHDVLEGRARQATNDRPRRGGHDGYRADRPRAALRASIVQTMRTVRMVRSLRSVAGRRRSGRADRVVRLA